MWSAIHSFIIILAICAAPGYFNLNSARQADETGQTKRGDQPPQAAAAPAVQLEFREFFEPGARQLKPSAKLLGLNGRRVRLVGFMAQMEHPPAGAFYLCPSPVYSDESGGGTAELPVEHVRVIMRAAEGREIPYLASPLEVTGILEVGNREEKDGTVSAIRLVLDGPQPSPSK
ncbi:MAG TPA: hypothetical protein VJ302_20740 [Blastocatellia bacterium]|nr:hypothetical protein [Blastocatellia bacterium]